MKNNKSKIWGGAFDSAPHNLMLQINESVSIDKKLYEEDILGSTVHVKMLAKQGIIEQAEADEIVRGLDQIKNEIESGDFQFRTELEDVHMNIESRLAEIVGAVAGKMHTARSRNDQVATDFKMYIRKQSEIIGELLKKLQFAFAKKAEENIETIMPGFTHLQAAQPVSFGHYLMAYLEMFDRDRSRINDLIERLNYSPLGSCALAGTSFPIDREYTAKMLGFKGPTKNSIDSVSDRDFVLEFLFVCSTISLHLSRFAEEMIIFSNENFSFIKISEEFSSGSSIMPQKRNPDSMELVRAKAGRIYGNLTSLFVIMKGLPLAYNKDMQEDKRPAIDSAEEIIQIIYLVINVVNSFYINKDVLLNAAAKGFSTATDLADWLVKNLKIPFRDAHFLTGNVVKFAEKQNCALQDLQIEDIKKIIPEANADLLELFHIKNSINSRNSYGGTSFKKVKEQIEQFYNNNTENS